MTRMRQVWRASPRPTTIMRTLRGFGVCFAHISSTVVSPKLVAYLKCGCCFARNCIRGLEYGQPARRTMFKVVFDGFS